MGPRSREQDAVADTEEREASGIMTLVTDAFFTALVYGLLVPMVSTAFGYSVPRSLCLEIACYYKAVHWTYSYLLPAIGHGVQVRQKTLISTTHPCHVMSHHVIRPSATLRPLAIYLKGTLTQHLHSKKMWHWSMRCTHSPC
jgi:deoxycytidylate deaminase